MKLPDKWQEVTKTNDINKIVILYNHIVFEIPFNL